MSGPAPVLRPAAAEDGPALARIDAETWSPAVTPAPRFSPDRPFFASCSPADVLVAELDGRVAAYARVAPHLPLSSAAHVQELKALAVDPAAQGRGVGHRIVSDLLARARELGVRRVFCLTFETKFFAKHGFVEIKGTPVSARVYEELLRSYDEGVAEFLDLERVKPNTLGNTRMLVHLNEPGTPRAV